MVRNSSPAMLAATAIVSLAIGFGATTLLPPPPPVIVEPIVDADAWKETSAAALTTEQVSYTRRADVLKCDPFNVSDVAMEEVLDEMVRRGWRAPRQGDAIALLDTAQTTGLSAVDPTAPMPSRRTWAYSNAVQGDTEVENVLQAPPLEPVTPSLEPETPEPPPA